MTPFAALPLDGVLRAVGRTRWLFRLFFRHRSILELPLVRSVLVRYYMRSVRGSRSVAWFTGPWATPADGLEAGHQLGE